MLLLNTLSEKQVSAETLRQIKLLFPKQLCVSVCVIQKPGCDFILGSKQQEDACMVCGGQNTTCLHHKSVYQSNGLEAGRIRMRTHTHTQASYYFHEESISAVLDQHDLGLIPVILSVFPPKCY